MNNVTIVGVLLVIIGVLAVAGAATADHTGLNLTQPKDSRNEAAFGWVQGVACAGGAMLVLAGVAIVFVAVRRTRLEEEADMAEEIAAHEEQERKIEAYKASQAEKVRSQAQAEGQADTADIQAQEPQGRDQTVSSDARTQEGVQGSRASSVEDPLDALGKEMDLDIASHHS